MFTETVQLEYTSISWTPGFCLFNYITRHNHHDELCYVVRMILEGENYVLITLTILLPDSVDAFPYKFLTQVHHNVDEVSEEVRKRNVIIIYLLKA